MRVRTLPTTTIESAATIERLASLVRPSQSVLYNPEQHRPAAFPTRLTIDGIGVYEVPVVGVGVKETGEMQIPEATEVGWYQYGVAPGEPGSAVLAAHISYDGRKGVFLHLVRINVGDEVVVEMSDGRELGFVVTETVRYSKEQLPLDRIFAKDGDPVLVLISCGGEFDRQLMSYSHNIVAYTAPAA